MHIVFVGVVGEKRSDLACLVFHGDSLSETKTGFCGPMKIVQCNRVGIEITPLVHGATLLVFTDTVAC